MARFSSKNKTSLRVFKPKKKTLKQGEFSFDIEALSEDGRGIARPEGKTTFVRGALPGERVKATYTAQHKNYDEANLIAVESESSSRVNPECEHYAACGGCTLQHLNYPQQIEFKESRLKAMFASLDADIHWESPLVASAFGYRHRLRLAVSANKQGVRLGFRRHNSHDIVDIQDCVVAQPVLGKKLSALRSEIASLHQRSVLSEVRLLEDSNGDVGLQLMVKKALNDDDYNRLENWVGTLDLAGVSVVQVLKKFEPPVLLWFSGSRDFIYKIQTQAGNLSLRFAIDDFTQVNPAINQQMVSRSLEWLELDAKDTVADFFCGVGNFSLPLAQASADVIGYESVDAMVKKARVNAADNSLGNVSFEVCNLFDERAVKRILKGESINKALLDPPRAGAQALSEGLVGSEMDMLLYVSCNPQSLLRDAQILVAAGYQIDKACLIDMFPQTTHIETMMLFRKRA